MAIENLPLAINFNKLIDANRNQVMLTSDDVKIRDYAHYDIKTLKEHLHERIGLMQLDEKVKNSLIVNIKKFPDNPSLKQRQELEKAAIVVEIIENTVFKHVNEVLSGGHVMVKDGGKLYDALVEKGIVKERHSSHHNQNKIKGKKDVSLQAGEIFREFLVGKTADGKTWFQLEAHSLGGFKNFIGHMIDYIKYKCTGKNVGQYGLSAHVDSKPIEVTQAEILSNIRSNMSKLDIKYHKNHKSSSVLQPSMSVNTEDFADRKNRSVSK